MNKLKSTFTLNSHAKKHELTEKRRSELFMKRHSSSALVVKQEEQETPKLHCEDLSETELKAYKTWWKNLDPFNLGKADNATIFKFLSGCHLPDTTLEEILELFQNQKDGLDQQEFYAMLRLIAHAQNGKTVHRDIIYLGAPLPRCQTQAVNALIDSNRPIEEDLVNRTSFDTTGSSWYSGISNATQHGTAQNSISSWMIQQQVSPPPTTSVELSLETVSIYNAFVSPSAKTHTLMQHSRSRSLPYANILYPTIDDQAPANNVGLYQFDTVDAFTSRQQQQTASRQHSLDQEALQSVINNGPPAVGPSLLLTHGFKPHLDCVDSNSSSNASSSFQSSPISTHNSKNPYKINLNNPFETDDSANSTPKQQLTPPLLHDNSILNNKTCFNSNHIPPPPVPPQSTKPPFPKYARRISIK